MANDPTFSADVLIRRGQAHVITLANGHYMVGPIHTTGLNVIELTSALEKTYQTGNPRLSESEIEELRSTGDVTLQAANVRSWKTLRQNAVMYSIEVYPKSIHIYPSDPKYSFFGSNRSMGYILPGESSWQKVAQTILDNVATREDVMNPPLEPDPPYKKPKPKTQKTAKDGDTPTLTDMMATYAEDAVELGRKGFKTTLDYSEASLKKVESILDRYHKDLPKKKADWPSEDEIWTIAKGWAGYIGEVIRKKWGGEWIHESYSPPGATIILKVGSIDVFLPAKVYKRLVNGSEDNTWHFYQVLKVQFELAGIKPK